MNNHQEDTKRSATWPAEPARLSRGRSLICPNCNVEFESMRRFQMSCPSCRHAWDEASVEAYRNSFEARNASLKDGMIRSAVALVLLSGPLLLLLFFASLVFQASSFGGIDTVLFLAIAFALFGLLTCVTVIVLSRRRALLDAPNRLWYWIQQINWPMG